MEAQQNLNTPEGSSSMASAIQTGSSPAHEKAGTTQSQLPQDDTETVRRSRFARLKHGTFFAPDPNPDHEVETRLVPHHYIFQRPRALQYTFKGEKIAYGGDAAPIAHQTSHSSLDIKYTAEGIAKARERLDLFIDLVWVGIISNLSEVFSISYFSAEHSAGVAFITFVLAFLPAFRIWNFLRDFLTNFYQDDPFQRAFVFWILVLSVFFGNNIAYFVEHIDEGKVILITLYLFIRASFLIITLVYCIWIPWLRWVTLVNFLIVMPTTGLWVATIYISQPASIGTAFAAIYWEYTVPILMDSRLGDKLIPGDYMKEVDPIHLRNRMGNFLIITIGEGVLTLIRGGPLGLGITAVSSIAVWSLLIYFVLAYLYFIKDNSVKYVPAVRHRGLRQIFWAGFHIPIFASYISLSAGILFLINENAETPLESTPHPIPEEAILDITYRALWVIASSLGIIIFSYTGMALLDRPLDPPKTLLINNRLLRLIGRPIYILIVCTVLLAPGMNVYLFMGICGLGLVLVLLWETFAALERPAKIFEPKGLTVLMKKEARAHAPKTAGDLPVRIVV